MSQIYTPRPTEYRGIVFRSKSEAMLACALDASDMWAWSYESKALRAASGYVPDFLMMQHTVGPERGGTLIVAEYKPIRPTETYLAGMFSDMQERAGSFPAICGALITGSFFENRKIEVHLFGLDTPQIEMLDPVEIFSLDIIDTARRYRFDIHGGPI